MNNIQIAIQPLPLNSLSGVSEVLPIGVTVEDGAVTIRCKAETTVQSLFGTFASDPFSKEIVFVDGPVTQAARQGLPVTLKGYRALARDAKAALEAAFEGYMLKLESGEVIFPADGFYVIAD